MRTPIGTILKAPSVNISIVIRPIAAGSFDEAVEIAYSSINFYFRSRLGIETLERYREAARCAREADGTYTVTLP